MTTNQTTDPGAYPVVTTGTGLERERYPVPVERRDREERRHVARLGDLRARTLSGNGQHHDASEIRSLREALNCWTPRGTHFRRWDDVTSVRRANAASGAYYFSRGALSAFTARVESEIIGGRYFVESTQPPHGGRLFTVRVVDDGGHVETVYRADAVDGAGGHMGELKNDSAFRTAAAARAYAADGLPAWPAPYFSAYALDRMETIESGHFDNEKWRGEIGGVKYRAHRSRRVFPADTDVRSGVIVESLDATPGAGWVTCGEEYRGGIA